MRIILSDILILVFLGETEQQPDYEQCHEDLPFQQLMWDYSGKNGER